ETGVRSASVTEAQAVQSLEPSAVAAMPAVDAQAVLANLENPSFTVVDARAANRYRGETEPMDPVAGHIPGALNRPSSLNVGDDGRFKAPAELRAEFEALLDGRPATQIVHQCGSGITACHNLFSMELAGLNGSALYPGSWSEWCSDSTRPVARI
ncbi:MAG TPA: rhodanese-like domain-containing protein, partial [Pusillimonas sp.]